MNSEKFNKLVRDKIPEVIKNQGQEPEYRILDDEEYLCELDKKLNEEVEEYQESKSLEELADILEVINAICKARGYTKEELNTTYMKKNKDRGGFEKRIFLISKKSY